MIGKILLSLLAAGSAAALAATGAAGPAAPTETAAVIYDHVSINVADFEKALAWYQTALGFEVETSWRVAALDGKRLAYLTLGAVRIELVEADAGAVMTPVAGSFPEHFARTGYGHLCLSVVDVDAALTELAEKGAPTFVRAETYALDGTPYERRVGFIQDPEGNVIEFAEPLRQRSR
jgi:catechol 2,3-dioxygenase-like lactoylglutathione lyase family enzyme